MMGAEVCKVFPITGAGVGGLSIAALPALPCTLALLHLLSARAGHSGQPVSSSPWGLGGLGQREGRKPEVEESERCLQDPRGPLPFPRPTLEVRAAGGDGPLAHHLYRHLGSPH